MSVTFEQFQEGLSKIEQVINEKFFEVNHKIGAMQEEIGAMSTKMEKIELFQLQEYGVILYS